ncbi:MAG TPA: outer membrane lipoprotein-sorting protein [Turneriella sp.]|nr:outer membrane lipoprotein-sorting protein [Turneriella sp.]HNE18688.1 outer membrane lipoprotein-sorting protein [Turneriella sp.]HNJ65559.1 outer membrane lipoprotein-sorting protein [Turneriella sp.]HNL09995.1 outer membrane lipoprotein-sorting protein [Turneriella sp.]HNL54107.1 outer membrane lipoprotein-sorting protein [Turneriella sp.]
MKKILFVVCLLTGALSAEDANSIVRKADAVRGPQGSFRMKIKVTSERPDQAKQEMFLETYVKDRTTSVVKFTDPARERGKAMLMVNDDLWMYIPGSKRTFRISPQQRLMGDVSNADVARVNFADDYNSTMVKKSDKVDGKDCYQLELTAKTKVSYSKIHYWVEHKTYRPVKATFFAVSGKPLKFATYTGYKTIAGSARPTLVHIVDGIKPDWKSEIHYTSMGAKTFPDSIFQQSALPDLR